MGGAAASQRARAVALRGLRDWLAGGPLPAPAGEAEAASLREEAWRQGVAGLLHATLERRQAPWPPHERERLAELHRAALARGVRRLEAAERLAARLEGRGLRLLPLKGIALAERLYDSPAERPMADIDLLALDGWPASASALRESGLRERESDGHAAAFEDPATGMVFELHRALTSCAEVFAVDGEGAWRRSAPGAGLRRPSPEDLLIHLSLHAAFQHGLVLSLVQYLDFRRLFEREPLDAERLLALAAEQRAEPALAAALGAAVAVAAAPVPHPVRDRLQEHLPAALRRRLGRAAADPLSLLAPAVPALAAVRWSLARGRRWRLVQGTLSLTPAAAGGTRPLRRLGEALRRAGSLAWRWAVVPAVSRAGLQWRRAPRA